MNFRVFIQLEVALDQVLYFGFSMSDGGRDTESSRHVKDKSPKGRVRSLAYGGIDNIRSHDTWKITESYEFTQ